MESVTRRTFITTLLALLPAAWLPARADSPGADVEVEILKFKFLPPTVHIKVGQQVRWINIEKRQYHSVWFEKLGDPEPDYLFPGDSYTRTFEQPGSFPYRCGPHPEMTGTVVVE